MNRYQNYKTITAKYDSTADCGHGIIKGQRIGYYPRKYPCGKTICADCWAKWQAENAAADADERFYESQRCY